MFYENDVAPFTNTLGDAYNLMRPLEKFQTITQLIVNNFKMKIMIVKSKNIDYAYSVKEQMSYTIPLDAKSIPIGITKMERVV